MNGRDDSFDDIVDGTDPERSRLRSAHDLLLAAGAPPELPPSLASAPPEPRAGVIAFPRRRNTAISTVAIAATVLFGVGYAIGDGRDSPQRPVQTIAMKGPAGATASIALLPKDLAGNWPMTLEVAGLAALPDGMTYTLWLTRDGKLAESCGAFAVAAGTTKVPLNAPYPLKEFDGWVVVRTGTTQPFLLQTGVA